MNGKNYLSFSSEVERGNKMLVVFLRQCTLLRRQTLKSECYIVEVPFIALSFVCIAISNTPDGMCRSE